MKFIFNMFSGMAIQMKAVNEKFREPEIEMTPFVRVCLIGLRVYLFTLVGLMVYKFIIVAKQGG